MSNKKISILYNVVMPVVTMATTAVLFFVFRPEDAGNLFYINLGYTLFLEAVFFGYLGLLQTKSNALSTPFYAVMGVHAVYYVIIGALCMLIYSVGLAEIFSIRIYISVILALTVLWFISAILLAKTDSDYKETVDELKSRQHSLHYYAQKLNILSVRYEKACAEKGVVYKTDSNNRTPLDKLKAKLNFLTPNVFSNDEACSRIDALLEQCSAIIGKTETAESDEIATQEKAMHNFINNAINEIELLKALTRK